MKKLELKHIAPYLPYRLKVLPTNNNEVLEVFTLNSVLFRNQIQIDTIRGTYGDMYFKPILRPLSDLKTHEFYDNFCKTYTTKVIDELIEGLRDVDFISYYHIQMLLDHHFDIFKLIKDNLAIDVNSVSNNRLYI